MVGELPRLVTCPYCGGTAKPLRGDALYPHLPRLYAKRFYRCARCDAHVGCHDGTWLPLGELANKPTRDARQRAHAVFDPLWMAKMRRDGCTKSAARKAAHTWLSEQMGIPFKDCHIGLFDVQQCEEAIAACASIRGRVDP